MHLPYTLVLLFLCCTFGYSQNPSEKEIEKSLDQYRSVYQPEKVYLHTDKEVYAAGETIWYAAYLVDGQNHLPIISNKSLQVELINAAGKVVHEQRLLLPIGQTAGDFSLPGELAAGDYLLRAYTNYQRNFGSDFLFTKKIRIQAGILAKSPANVSASSNIQSGADFAPTLQLQFFPEGGDCINGLACRLAFLANLEDGSPAEINGRIEDENGEIITFFETIGRGMGSVNFTPQAGMRYQAMVEDRGREQSFTLPDYLDRGYNLQLVEKSDTLQIKVLSNLDGGLKRAMLVLHLRGLLVASLPLQENANALVKIPKSELPPGILSVTLFNPIGDPVAERLCFIDSSREVPDLLIQATKPSYPLGSQGKISLQVHSTADTVPPALLSASIISDDFYRSTAENIRSYLLLNADLSIPIEEAGALVTDQASAAQIRLLDHLLMTKGWRRFRWQPLLDNELPDITYAHEEGIYLAGRLHKYENKNKLEEGKAFMAILGDQFYSEETATNEEGEFRFGPFVFFDTSNVVLQARIPRNRKAKLAELTLDDNPYVKIEVTEKQAAPISPLDTPWVWDKNILSAYRTQSEQSLTIARNFDSLIIDLDVVELRASRIEKKTTYDERASYYGNPDNRMVIDSMGGSTALQSIFDVLRRVAGVIVTGPRNQETVSIRGATSIQLSSEPIYILDGLQVDIDALRNYPIINVEFIDVIKGARAAIYGSRGANGAILVYSRQGPSLINRLNPGVLNIELAGFYKAREFYVADTRTNPNRPDIRTTLHWQPDLITDDQGKAQLDFQTSQQSGIYRVIVEGIDANGRPLFATTTFEVK